MSVVFVRQKRQAGITLLEVVIAIIVFSVLIGTILESIHYYQGLAEEAAVQRLVTNMQTALSGRHYQAMVTGKHLDTGVLMRENPISWLQNSPDNYRGEIANSATISMTPGSWYFDVSEHKLVYVFSSKKSFRGDSFERWFFKVKSISLPTNTAKQVEASQAEPGVTLVKVDSG